MIKKSLHFQAAVGCVSLMMLGVNCEAKAPAKKESVGKKNPNLVFIFSDQQSYDMLGCYGNKQIITPNLDNFATQGVRFTNCFSNCPVSTPYRGMLLTGQQSLYNGTFANDKPLIPGNGKKFAEVLSDEGYNTAYVGKWHLLGGDRDRPIPQGEMRYGFDELFLTNNCHVNYTKGACFYWNDKGQKVFFDDWEVYGQTNQALDYLDTRKQNEQPFALFVSWHPPHDWGKFDGEDGKKHYRYDAPEELMAMYNRDDIKMRPGLKNTPDRRRMYHGHMAMATGVDKAFGQLMDKLKAMGLDENTLVVFTSDHGDMLESFNAQLPKEVPLDYSARVPLMLRMPKTLKTNATSSLLISALDMMPTVLGLMNLDVPKECQGKNLAKAIVTGDEDAVKYIPMWMYHGRGWRGVITKDFTFSIQPGDAVASINSVLFDRKNDPYQLKNCFASPEYAEKKAEMLKLTKEWMADYGDEFWTLADFWKALPSEQWNVNRTQRPIDIMKGKK